jgi:hypothetical protein
MSSRKIVECECGKTWELNRVKLGMRDDDSLHCSCGQVLIHWNGGYVWTGKVIAEKNPKPK